MPDPQNEKRTETSAIETHNTVIDVEMTQKIDFDYKEAFGSESITAISSSSKKIRNRSFPNLFHENFLFAKKTIPDDYVKSSSIACVISSISALEAGVKLQDIHDNYVLKKQIAEGAQGVVSTGFDKSLKRDIVVKSAKTEHGQGDAIKDNNFFVSEARIMAQLDHPAIAPIYGMFSDREGKLHLTMKHIHGTTLKDYLQGIAVLYQRNGVGGYAERDSILTRIEYLIRVCEAVDYAHCRGVIHRDLKPENIIIGSHSEIYVMDWGLACLMSPDESPGSEHLTEIGLHLRCELAGTPCYIAPELIRGGLTSPQSDIFSLGMILFEIVTLTRAVPGNTIDEVFRNILKRNYMPFKHRFLKGKLPDDLKAIVAKATSPSLSRRYKTARDMAKDLRSYLMHKETSARPDNFLRKCLRGVSSHVMITASLILIMLLVMTLIVLYGLHSQNVLINKQKTREAIVTHFQYMVIERSNKLNYAIRYLESQLTNLVNHSKYVLDNKEGDVNGNYVHYLGYAGKIKSKNAVNWNSKSLADKRRLIFPEILKHMSVTCNSTFRHQAANPDKQKNGNNDKAVIGVFAGFPNDSILTYPDGRRYAEECHPGKRACYKEALSKNTVVWSEPFKCVVCSKIVICCLKRVSDNDNKTLGVVGMDIDLGYIHKYLFNNEIPGTQEFLLNKRGEIILSNNFKYENTKINPNTRKLILKKFAFNKEFQDALRNGRLQFKVRKYKRSYIFGISHIPSLNYYYIEQTSESSLWETHQKHTH